MIDSQLIEKYKNTSILVVGDMMLDRYWHGNTSRTSPEAPVPIVHVSRSEERVGGAANAAMNLAALGIRTTLMGLMGTDEAGQAIRQITEHHGIQLRCIEQPDLETITKLRVMSHHQQLIRVDFEKNFGSVDKQSFMQEYTEQLKACDAVILSDYGKGTLSDCQALINAAKKLGKTVYVDPNGNDFNRYRGATVLKPNLKEFEAIVGPCPDEETLIVKGKQLLQAYDIETLLVTRGGDGMILLREDSAPYSVLARSREIFDVTGAGDTVMAVFAASIAAGIDIIAAMELSNEAAGLVVNKLGTSTVTAEELFLSSRDGIVDRKNLKEKIKLAQHAGKRVVMTNGCFDLLHAGHVSFLEEAKKQGDYLLVALNDDDSVSRLKGPQRPLFPIQQRLQLVAALESVDWVVSFDEDTPEALLRELQPNILVKGGDYSVEAVVGADIVRSYGGQVKVLPHDFSECSTTRIVERIKSV